MDTTSYLTPGPEFWVTLLVAFAVFVMLVALPLGQAAREGRVGWAFAIFVLAPFGGLAWFVSKRSSSRSTGTASTTA